MTTGHESPTANPAEAMSRTAGTPPGHAVAASLSAVDPGWAWARFEPSPEKPWSPGMAAHLLRRAGFGATRAELQTSLKDGPQAAVDLLLRPPESYGAFETEFEVHEAAAARSGDGLALDGWWLRRLRESPWPLLEKLTLLWHGHFAIRSSAVGDLQFMHHHVGLLRKEALSDFPSLLATMAGDPAMYTGLGGEYNRKAQPNLRFAKPWLEAFTVGPDLASPSEVANLARAWTGWCVYGGKLRFIEREHDPAPKRLLGSDGIIGRDDAVQLLGSHPATAKAVARRLFRTFISENESPPDALLSPVAQRLGRKESIRQVLDFILRSNLFFSEYAVGQCIKSPVELAVGLVRSLEGRLPASELASELSNLGQRLGEPPTVRGWAGGLNWINTLTLAARLRVCESLAIGLAGTEFEPAQGAPAERPSSSEGQVRALIERLLPIHLSDATVRGIAAKAASSPRPGQAVLRGIIAQPEFQLT